METCITRKIIRKSAESAMANFLPIEEFRIPLIVDLIFLLVQQKYSRIHVLATDHSHNYLFRMVLIRSQTLDLRLYYR